LLINGDLNDLLDRELYKDQGFEGLHEITPKVGSAHVSALKRESPLEAYADRQSDDRHAFTCKQSTSQRSSFDDSFNETYFNPFLSLAGTPLNPLSISFVGDGLLKPEEIVEEQEATDIEANLIQQSMSHIQAIFVQRKTNDVSSVSNSTSDEKQRSNQTRRLRVF